MKISFTIQNLKQYSMLKVIPVETSQSILKNKNLEYAGILLYFKLLSDTFFNNVLEKIKNSLSST